MLKNTLRPLVNAGLLFKGDLLVSARVKRKKCPGLAEITENAKIRILYPLDLAGQTYDTPSPAGAAITGWRADDGWFTWAVVRLKNCPNGPIPRHIYFGQGISENKLETILLDDLRKGSRRI